MTKISALCLQNPKNRALNKRLSWLNYFSIFIVWFSLTWSLQDYIQLCGRINRQGRKEETVVIGHIITEGTIDERILKALESKESTQSRLLEAVRAEI